MGIIRFVPITSWRSTVTKQTKSATLDSPQVRFSWGFHDAVTECERNSRRDVSNHFDATYAEGYKRGIEAHRAIGVKAVSSESAWQCREDSRKEDAARRKRMRDARPPASTVRV